MQKHIAEIATNVLRIELDRFGRYLIILGLHFGDRLSLGAFFEG